MFDALKQLPDEYYVFHSLSYTRVKENAFTEGEADFVIFHPKKGIIALEAKAGQVRYENGQWLYSSGIEMRHGGSFRQASRNMHNIMDHIDDSRLSDIRKRCKFLYAVWFPSISDEQLNAINLPADANTSMILKVKETEVWNKFADTYDAEFNLASLANQTTSFILTDFSCVEDELKGIVTGLAETLGSDGIIVADTTNINVDPFAYIVYSLGEGVRKKNQNHSEYQDETDITDLAECFNYKNHFTFNAEELENLKQFGIERVKEGKKLIFREIVPNEGLSDEIFLTDTRFEGRTERIENIKVGDPVTNVRVKNEKSLPKMIEVFTEEGSLGFLDYDASEIMAPIIDNGDKNFTAEVYGVIPSNEDFVL